MNPLPSSTLVPLESLILHDAHRQDRIFCMCVCVCVCVCVQLQKPLSAGVPPVFGRSVRVNLSSCNYCEFCWRVSQD